MIWDTSAGTFIVDDEKAEAQGWRTQVDAAGGVSWVKEFRRGLGYDVLLDRLHEGDRCES